MRITIKLWQKDKPIYSYTLSKRQLLYDRLRTHKFSKGYIKVNYGNGFYNDAEFLTLQDAKWFLSAFTEKDLVDTFKNNT